MTSIASPFISRIVRLGVAAMTVAAVAVAAAAPAAAGDGTNYVIGPQDVLSVAVFNQATLGGKYAVELDGSFSFPLIGRVKAAGMTLRDVETELTSRLANGYFNNPQVTVTVEQYRSQRISITGEVKNAGTYALTGDMSLIEALAKAGSTTPAAGDQVVIVRDRQPGAAGAAHGEDVVKVNLKDLQSGAGGVRNIELRDGDKIFVPRAELVYVFGQVKNPGAYPIQSDTTVLQVLSLAGGVTPYAATNRVEVVRVVNGEKKEQKVKLTDSLQPGDTVVVPERFF